MVNKLKLKTFTAVDSVQEWNVYTADYILN